MSFTIISELHGPLELVPAYPADYRGLQLAGSTPYTAQGAFGSILIQEVVQGKIRIRYIILRTLEKLVLHWREEKSLRMQVALQNDFRYQGDKGIVRVRPSHFNMVWAPEREGTGYFDKGKEYRIFSTHFAPPLVRRLLPRFPEEELAFEEPVRPLEPQLNALMQKVLTNPYSDAWRRFFYGNKVREILFTMLISLQAETERGGFTEEEVSRVHQVDALILSDLTKHYTIRQLAKKVRMSQERLKEAFKAIIGVGMYERLKEARLQKAREILLTTNLPSKAIYQQAGYESITGFMDAFKARFGLPPMQYRKKYRPKA